MTTAIAAVLWPYSNPTIGSGIFTDTDVPAVVHGNDSSLDTHAAAAVVQMPQMIFHPVKTLVGQMKLLCLRGHTSGAVSPWSTANSLRTFANTGGTFTDSTFSSSSPITQDYQLTWGSGHRLVQPGLLRRPHLRAQDRIRGRQRGRGHGLFNKRIKIRGRHVARHPHRRHAHDDRHAIPDPGHRRRRAAPAAPPKSTAVTVTGADGKVYLAFPLGQLVKSKLQNGVEQLREGEVAWEALPP